MSATIAQTAVVDPQAEIGNNVEIGHFCVIGPDVKIGDGTRIEENVVLKGITTIGESNHVLPGCVIGAPPQDLSYNNEPTCVIIGDGNTFREHCTVTARRKKKMASRALVTTTISWLGPTLHTTAKLVTEL